MSNGRLKQARGDLSDAQWALIESLFPRQRRGGRWNDHRLVFNGVLWVLRTESKSFVELMHKVRPPRWTGWPLETAGGKGCSYPRVRRWLERRCIEQVIPQRSDQVRHEGRSRLDKRSYRKRARVEQSPGWLKENRRVGTRYDKLATSFLAFVNLAIVRTYLRALAPDDPSEGA